MIFFFTFMKIFRYTLIEWEPSDSIIFYNSFHRHNAGIKSVVPEPNGTKLILLDVKASGYVFNPINDELLVIRSFPENVKVILWDNSITDKDIFVALDHNNVLSLHISSFST